MRQIALLSMLLMAVGCASTATSPAMRQHCEDRYDEVWTAARTAVMRLGGQVIDASRSAGSILGRLELDGFGAAVDLHIQLSRIPDHQPGTQQPVTVTIRATEAAGREPDPTRANELRSLEERYLRLVGERASCGGPG